MMGGSVWGSPCHPPPPAHLWTPLPASLGVSQQGAAVPARQSGGPPAGAGAAGQEACGPRAEGETEPVRPRGRTMLPEEGWAELGAAGSGDGDALDPRRPAKPESLNYGPSTASPRTSGTEASAQERTPHINGQPTWDRGQE